MRLPPVDVTDESCGSMNMISLSTAERDYAYFLLSHHFGYKLEVASKRLGVCITTIKKVRRLLGMKRWPYRALRRVDSLASHMGSNGREEVVAMQQSKARAAVINECGRETIHEFLNSCRRGRGVARLPEPDEMTWDA